MLPCTRVIAVGARREVKGVFWKQSQQDLPMSVGGAGRESGEFKNAPMIFALSKRVDGGKYV
jgi:hypothetical protein